jgi:hypothetical protein
MTNAVEASGEKSRRHHRLQQRGINIMQPIDESIVFAAIRQCLETADHYIRQGNRRDAEFYLDRAKAYADRIIFCRTRGVP